MSTPKNARIDVFFLPEIHPSRRSHKSWPKRANELDNCGVSHMYPAVATMTRCVPHPSEDIKTSRQTSKATSNKLDIRDEMVLMPCSSFGNHCSEQHLSISSI